VTGTRRAILAAMALALGGCSSAVPPPPAPPAASRPAPPPATADAGPLYRKALAAAPTSPLATAILESWKDAPLNDPTVATVLADGAAALGLLREARRAARCDWGIDPDAAEPDLSPLNNLRRLTSLVCLRARQ